MLNGASEEHTIWPFCIGEKRPTFDLGPRR
jgi:hypothetical protein